MKNRFANALGFKKSAALQALEDVIEKLEQVELRYQGSMNTSILEIPHDRYVELRYNIFVRQMVDETDILFDYESCADTIIQNIDFDENIVLAVKFDQGEGFPAHSHQMQETLRCLKGSYKDGVNNVVYNEGETQIVPALQLHSFIPLEDGFAIVELRK